MSAGLRRGLSDFACRALQATLPPSLESWGWAVRCETAEIPDDTKALLFALDSLFGDSMDWRGAVGQARRTFHPTEPHPAARDARRFRAIP